MAIITLADLKTYLDITDSSEDTKLTTIVNAVNVTVNNYVGRVMESADYIEMYDGPGTEALVLRNFPVTEITEILVLGQVMTQWLGDDDDYPSNVDTILQWYLKDSGETGIVFNRYCWPNGRGAIMIEYEAGYETIPADIFLGTLQLAAYWRNITQPGHIGVVSQYLGSHNVTLMNSISHTNYDLSIADPVFRMILDQERAKSARELVF